MVNKRQRVSIPVGQLGLIVALSILAVGCRSRPAYGDLTIAEVERLAAKLKLSDQNRKWKELIGDPYGSKPMIVRLVRYIHEVELMGDRELADLYDIQLPITQIADDQQAMEIRGFEYEVIAPQEFAGRRFEVHHDGVFASGDPREYSVADKYYMIYGDDSFFVRPPPCSILVPIFELVR